MYRINKRRRIHAVLISFVMLLQSGFLLPQIAYAEGETYSYTIDFQEKTHLNGIFINDFEDQDPVRYAVVPEEAKEDNGYGVMTAYLHDAYPWGGTNYEGRAGEKIPEWPTGIENEPYRIINYTFKGYIKRRIREGNASQDYFPIDQDTVMNDDVLNYETRSGTKVYEGTFQKGDMQGSSMDNTLLGYYDKFSNADITAGSFKISAMDKEPSPLYPDSDIKIYDASDPTNENITDGVTEYKAQVYGDCEYLTLNFNMFEPEAQCEITYKAADSDEYETIPQIDLEKISGTVYRLPNDEDDVEDRDWELVKDETYVSVDAGTQLNKIQLKDGDNVIKIRVFLPEAKHWYDTYDSGGYHVVRKSKTKSVVEKTYTITVNRSYRKIVPNNGNSPYGDYSSQVSPRMEYSEENDKITFNSDTIYDYKHTFSKDVWTGADSSKEEIPKHNVPASAEYINYDKDISSIFVYAGNTFTDPGLTIYDKDNEKISISGVSRKIYKYGDESQTPVMSVANQTEGEDNRTNIVIPKTLPVGMYVIEYSGKVDDVDLTARRYMFVIPQPGDLNTDGYANSLDVNEFDKYKAVNGTDEDGVYKLPSEPEIADYLYYYRAMDINQDGKVTDADRTMLDTRTSVQSIANTTINDIPYFYRDLSVYPALTKNKYTAPSGDTYASLSLDYLGKGDAPASSKVVQSDSETDKLDSPDTEGEGADTFWVGFRLADLDKAPEFENGINSMTIALDYDSRYITPADNWKDIVNNSDYNAHLKGYSFGGTTDTAAEYTYDNSTAYNEWVNDTQIQSLRTLVVDLYSNGTLNTLPEDGYLLKVPFTVKNVPTPTYIGTPIIAEKFGAKTFNISFGDKGQTYKEMWDMTERYNETGTNSINSHIKYSSMPLLKFNNPRNTEILTSAKGFVFGSSVTIVNEASFAGVKEADLHKGLDYYPNLNAIRGTAWESGEKLFYIGGKPFSLTVSPMPITITADDMNLVYGEPVPDEVSYSYSNVTYDPEIPSTIDFKTDVVKTGPTRTITNDNITATSPYGTEGTITLSGMELKESYSGNSDLKLAENYELRYVDGTAKVNERRKIKITAVDLAPEEIPELTKDMINLKQYSFENQTAVKSKLTVELDSDQNTTGKAILDSDNISIKYTLTYTVLNDQNPQYRIEDIELVGDSAVLNNYELIPNTITQSGGKVEAKVPVRLRHTWTGGEKLTYTYGETLNLDDLNIKLVYDTGYEDNLKYSDIGDPNNEIGKYITAYYSDHTDIKPLSDGDHNGRLYVKTSGKTDRIASGEKIVFVFDNGSYHYTTETAPITVNPKTMHVYGVDQSRYYGEDNSALNTEIKANLPMYLKYDEMSDWDKTAWTNAGFTEDQVVSQADVQKVIDGYAAPGIRVSERTAADTEVNLDEEGKVIPLPAETGEIELYTARILGLADNYTIEPVNAKLTIKKRPLKLISVDRSCIPALTYEDYNGKTEYILETDGVEYNGSVRTATLRTLNVSSGEITQNAPLFSDAIKVNFKVQYADATPTLPTANAYATVRIINAELDTSGDYARGKNYEFVNVDEDANAVYVEGGKVRKARYLKDIYYDKDKLPQGSSSGSDKPKTRKETYTYGDWLNTSEKNIILEYDNGDKVSVSIDDLETDTYRYLPTSDFGANAGSVGRYNFITVRYNTGSEPRGGENGDKLAVKDNRTSIVISVTEPDSEYTVESITTELKVNPKVIHFKVNDQSMTYGDEPPEYTYEILTDLAFNENSQLNSERDNSRTNLAGWTYPIIYSRESNTSAEISRTTNVGTYRLVLTGGSADNYVFAAESDSSVSLPAYGTLKINQRPVHIDNIVSVETLTADRVYQYSLNQSDQSLLEYEMQNIVVPYSNMNTIGNLRARTGDIVNGDRISITYRIRYDTVDTDEGRTVKPGTGKSVTLVGYNLDSAYDYHNYYITSFVQSANNGICLEDYLDTIELVEEPDGTDDYTYGDTFDLSRYKMKLTYRSGKVIDSVPLGDLSSYNASAAIKYTTLGTTATSNDLMKPAVHTNDTLTITFNKYDTLNKSYIGEQAEPIVTTAKINVAKKTMHVTVNPSEAVYGTEPQYSYTMHEEDLAPADLDSGRFDSSGFNEGFTALPNLVSYESGEKQTQVHAGTDVGEYTIEFPEEYESTNYTFDLTDTNTLTIKQRPLEIISINSSQISPLTRSKIVSERHALGEARLLPIDLAGTAVGSAESTELELAEGDESSGIFGTDEIGIKFDARYDSADGADSYTVKIIYADDNGWLDTENYPKGKNYNIMSKPETAEGSIEYTAITGLIVAEDPNMAYDYGQSFNLANGSLGLVKVIYDNDSEDLTYAKECDFTTLSDYNLKATFEDSDEEVMNGTYLTRKTHNGKKIKVTLEGSDPEISAYTTDTINIAKHNMKVIVEPQSKIYGDDVQDITNSYHFDESNLVNGDTLTSENFLAGLVRPTISCDITADSEVGTYTITASGAESDNYEFTIYEEADFTVEKRPVWVHSIDSGIPVLTSKTIYDEKGSLFRLDGEAYTDNSSKKANIYGKLVDDNIKITYKAVYSSTEPSNNYTVGIEDIQIDDSYDKGKNYVLSTENKSAETASGGVIRDRAITDIKIDQQPKLEYTYGDALNLNGGRVIISYDSGEAEYFKFNELPLSRVSLTYSNGETASDHDKLTVPYHNNNTLTVRCTEIGSTNIYDTSQKLTVHKGTLNIDVEDVNTTYGDPIELKWSWRSSDFIDNEVFTEDENSDTFRKAMREPVIRCVDNEGNAVSSATDAGQYEITVSGAQADNYNIVYHNALLTIAKRPMNVLAINRIPMLRGKDWAEYTAPPYPKTSTAVNTAGEFSAENVVNDDSIRINFTAVYSNNNPADTVTVGIENVSLDETYGKSSNYSLVYVTPSSPYGKVNNSNIERMRVITNPTLRYSYGDTLELGEGRIRVYLDDGTTDDIAMNNLSEYGLDFKYTDNDEDVENGVKLSIAGYDGRSFKIAVPEGDSIYEAEPITIGPLEVSKRLLRIGECSAEPIIYDGSTTLTTGTIAILNTLEDEPVTVSGDFNFENCNAGTNKRVYITNIKLDDEDGTLADIYTLDTDNTVTYSTIEKKDTETPTDEIVYEFTDDTNTLIITMPSFTGLLGEGGAEYEYSIDGGATWTRSNIFENLETGHVCSICVRIADTSNFNVSEPTEPVEARSFVVHFIIKTLDEPLNPKPDDYDEAASGPWIYEYPDMFSLFTNTTQFETEEELREFVDAHRENTTVNYYGLYTNSETRESVSFPYEFLGETTIYTSLTAPRRRGGGGGGNGGGSEGVTTKINVSIVKEDGTEEEIKEIVVEAGADPIKLDGTLSVESKNTTIQWNSSNESVVKVSSDGTLTFVGEGTAEITAVSSKNKQISTTIPITVKSPEPDTTASPEPTATPTAEPTSSPATPPEPTSTTDIGDKRMNKPYMSGFDGLIRPDEYMSRAEAATIMVQLAGDTGEAYENVFPDVEADAWYVNIVAQAYARGLISGFDDGNFYPEDPITREQFVTMTTKLAGLESINGETIFTDVSAERWSAGFINAAVEKEIASGYEDGTFLPENLIKRCEAVRMANAAIGRVPDKEIIDTIPCPFTDLLSTHWAYYEIMAASCEYELK